MPVFHQPIRIKQQLCSIAQFTGGKFLMSLKNGDVTICPKSFRQGRNEIEYKKKQAKCLKVNKIKSGNFNRTAQMMK